MRPRKDELIDPEIAEQLDAIDATLAGEPVAPRFAELAELAVLLSAGRPEGPRPEFAGELDRRVAARFAQVAGGRSGHGAATAGRGGTARRSRWRLPGLAPVLGVAATALAAVVLAVLAIGSGGGRSTGTTLLDRPAVAAGPAAHAGAATKSASPSVAGGSPSVAGGSGASGAAHGRASTAPPSSASVNGSLARRQSVAKPVLVTRPHGTTMTTPNAPLAPAPALGAPATASPAPVPNGRKIVQSSTLQLGAPAARIDTVAQEVFNVVGTVRGIVDSSNVSSTGTPAAGAQFQLRLPSASLPLALSELSRLRYAHVIARIDNTEDINSTYLTTQRQIANATAALATLRVKLAAATLSSQIASLKAQIGNEQATLARLQGSLRSLNHQVDYSRVTVSIQAATALTPPASGGGFGLDQAGHDALRVLTVTAAVALIALAALVPISLVVALAWWCAVAVQRRRRERALDLA